MDSTAGAAAMRSRLATDQDARMPARCARLHSCVRGGVRFDGLREALFFVLCLLVQRCEVGCVC